MDFFFFRSIIFVLSSDWYMQVITWTELIVMLAIGAAAWYAYVLLRYYRDILIKSGPSRAVPVKWTRETPAASASDIHAQVHELMQSLKDVLTASVNDRLIKAQVLDALEHRLKKNSHLPAEIKSSITQHLVNECSLQLDMIITEQQINALW